MILELNINHNFSKPRSGSQAHGIFSQMRVIVRFDISTGLYNNMKMRDLDLKADNDLHVVSRDREKEERL